MQRALLRGPTWTTTAVRLAPRRSINAPISGLLGAQIGPIAADVLRLRRRLTHRNPRPRHARIAPFVPSVGLAVGHEVFGPIRIMLKERDGTDTVDAS